MDGGFAWRRIAGENRLSPHAFGIAFDISPGIATYWRWSKLRPHPLQQSYPSAIVEAFENEGFIWGGKWHEYDLMHFEYRPEIICKARVWQGLEPLPNNDAPKNLAQPAVSSVPVAPSGEAPAPGRRLCRAICQPVTEAVTHRRHPPHQNELTVKMQKAP